MKSVNGIGPGVLELPWHAQASLLLRAHSSRLILLVGEPGCGKTTWAQAAAQQMTGKPPQRLNGTPEVDEQHLWGRWSAAGGETRFIEGPLTLALRRPCYLIIEEFSQIPLEVRQALLPLRDQKQIECPVTHEVFEISPRFRLIATSNSESLTCRRNSGLARVLYDGFLTLEVPDLTSEQVGRLLEHHFPHAAPQQVKRTLELWQQYRDMAAGRGEEAEGRSRLSYRAAAHLLDLLALGVEESVAVQVALINKWMATDPDFFSAARLQNSIA